MNKFRETVLQKRPLSIRSIGSVDTYIFIGEEHGLFCIVEYSISPEPHLYTDLVLSHRHRAMIYALQIA